MPNKYRLILQTTQRYFVLGGASQINLLPEVLAQWFANSIPGRGVYDDQVQAILLYAYDPMSNSYQLKARAAADSRQTAINEIAGFIGVV